MASACAADNKKDNYNSLRKKEKYIPSLKKTCPVPKCRAKMVKWIIAACEKHDQFFPATYSLATLLLDGYTDRNQVPERDMYLVAGCCLLIAGIVHYATILQKIEKPKLRITMVCDLNMNSIKLSIN